MSIRSKLKKAIERMFPKSEMNRILKYCKDVERDKLLGGCGTFYPEPDDEYLWKIMVKKGLVIPSPTGKGYMLPSGYEQIWGGDVAEKILQNSKEKPISRKEEK